MKHGSLTWPLMGAAALAVSGVGGLWTGASAAPVNGVPAPRQASAAPLSFANLVEQVAPAVVSIDIVGKPKTKIAFQRGEGDQEGQAPDPRQFLNPFRQGQPQEQPAEPMRASGSGFFISADGYILTNNHVVEDAQEITVRTKDDKEVKAHLIGRDPATDLAVIKVDGSGYPYVSFEDRAMPRVGDWVVAVGNPFGLGGTATAGIVSALARKNVSDSSFVDYMQIDAPINSGNSGGPTFDIQGRVVGVNTAIFTPSGGSVGIGFDIPADVAASVSRQLIANGHIVRGYIGAQVQDVTGDIADSLGLAGRKGALIADVVAGGPAETGGLKAGDVVLDVNGHEIESASDMTRQVALASPGQDIRFKVRRDGAMQTVVVKSGRRPSEEELAANGRAPRQEEGQEGTRVLGMNVAPDASGGLKIEAVQNGSDARAKGLQAGDVIRRVGGQAVGTLSDLSATVDAARKAGRKDVLLLIARNGHQLFVPLHVEEAAG